MVFMGTEKYPTENTLDMFTAKHGGTYNACTGSCNQLTLNSYKLLLAFPWPIEWFLIYIRNREMKEMKLLPTTE